MMSLMVEVQNGSLLLLAYFRESSKNKAVTQINWREKKSYRFFADLSDEQILFMTSLSRLIGDNNLRRNSRCSRWHDWHKLTDSVDRFSMENIPRHHIDDDYFFTGQMFVPVWRPWSPVMSLPTESLMA